MGIRKWATLMGIGAGFMYFYDPQQGNRRRATLRDQWMHTQHDAKNFWGSAKRDLQNRAQGVKSDPNALRDMVGQAATTEGQWSPGVRLVAAIAGGGLTFYGLANRGIKGTAATLFGLNLVSRGITNSSLRNLMNRSGEASAIDFQKSLTVNAPVSEVFSFWRNYSNFPLFMNHVREVRDLGNGRSHWVVEGPAKSQVEWDAVMTDLEPDRLIAWQSLPDSQVPNGGRVQFQKHGDGTRVDVHLWYQPPAGPIGHAVASLFGTDPKSAMDSDMARFKSLIEKGKTSTDSGQVTKGQVANSQGTSGSRSPSTEQHAGPSASGNQPGTPKPTSGTGGGSQSNTPKAQKPDVGSESGLPGSGKGRTDQVGNTGVYPASDPTAPADAEAQPMASFGQGDRGAEGYNDSGRSELWGLKDEDQADESEKPSDEDTGNFDSMLPGNPADRS